MTKSTSSEKLKTKLIKLQEKYNQDLKKKLNTIEEVWQNLLKNPQDREKIRELLRNIHNLAGSAASFGFVLLGDIAHLLETYLKELLQKEQEFTLEHQVHIESLLKALKDASQDCDLNLLENNLILDTRKLNATKVSDGLVYVVDDDQTLGEELGAQLRSFGYRVKVFSRIDDLLEGIRKELPLVAIIDLMFPEGAFAGPEAIYELKQKIAKEFKVIFVSVRKDLDARLTAIRAEGDAYFTKPLQINALVNSIEEMICPKTPEPSRILIVEDDPIMADYYATILKSSGMITRVLTDPLKTQNTLVEFRPDLLLSDLYMPGCNGLELAQAIRQQEDFINLPILFLSTETNLEIQFEALKLGADDFLTKPIEPKQLVSIIKAKVTRAIALRNRMVRDSLTGLLNHGKLNDSLEMETIRAIRQNNHLCFAMIDIDHFKMVNDTYGHPVGDRVLKSLSLLLQQRLRKTDIIGRYGGEEFGIIFIDTDGPSAVLILNEIREKFDQSVHQFDGGEFKVTFSGGIASFPQFKTSENLREAADKALYEAKRAGRNRIILASKF